MLSNHPLSFPVTMFIVLIWLTWPSAHKGRGVSSRSDGQLFRIQDPASQLTGLRSIGFTARWEKLLDINFGTVKKGKNKTTTPTHTHTHTHTRARAQRTHNRERERERPPGHIKSTHHKPNKKYTGTEDKETRWAFQNTLFVRHFTDKRITISGLNHVHGCI